MPQLITAIFEKDGRVFTLPGFQYLTSKKSEEFLPDEDIGNPIQISFKAMSLASILQAKLSWRKFETTNDEPWTINVPCAEGTIISRHFEHGGCKIWIFSGPEMETYLESQIYA